LPVDAFSQVWQDGAAMNASEKQFSFTRAALSTGGRPKTNFLPVPFAVVRVSRRPILFGSEIDSLTLEQRQACKHFKANVVFPGGVVVRDGYWLLALGVNDSACAVAKVTPAALNL
jgi:hypothetical protein